MCLAIPGKLVAITEELDETFRIGKVSFDGIMKKVNLTMVPEAKAGDYVLVHVGAAIQVVELRSPDTSVSASGVRPHFTGQKVWMV